MIASVTMAAPTRCAKWIAIFGSQWSGDEAAEHEREIRDREPGVGVPHGRAHEDLRVDQGGGGGGDAPQHRVVQARNAFGSWLVIRGHPPRRGEERDGHREAEKDLGKARMRGRNGRREEEHHGQAAEHALRDDGRERRDTEPSQPAPRLLQPQPRGQDDGEEPDEAGD